MKLSKIKCRFLKHWLLAIIFPFLLMKGSSQSTNQIKGAVLDEKGNPLANVTVQLSKSGNDTILKTTQTNEKGIFEISSIQTNIFYHFRFSYVGYDSYNIDSLNVLNGTNSSILVHLRVANSDLNQVVVIGYGTQKKKDLTGSIATISEKDFNKGAVTSPQDLVVGKIPGVVISSNGGAPGAGSTIRIRGGSSMSASNDPLIVIDGVPVDNDAITGLANPLSTINPNDIETFTVLKDASATAIYGSRASNGVILITTKKGSRQLRVSYNGSFSLYTRPKKFDVLSADDFRSLIKEKQPDEADILGSANTDWQDEIFHNSVGNDHNVSISGPTKIAPYRLSLGYTNQSGILKTSNIDRTTMAFNLNPSLLDNHLKINLNFKGTYNHTRFAETGAINAAITMDPTQPVKNGNQFQDGYFAWLTNGNLNNQATTNPVALLNLTNNTARIYRGIGNLQTDYKFHFLPELHANLNLALDYSDSKGNIFTPENTSWTTSFEGSKQHYTQTKKMQLLEFYLNYAKDMSSIKSRVDATAGYSHQHFRNDTYTLATNASGTTVLSELPAKSQNYLISFFGRLNYTYDNQYLLTVTVRNDGSSRFAKGNRWGLFPSTAFAWKLKESSFLKNSAVFSDLKLRLGYGKTGQQDIGEDYPYLAKFTRSSLDSTAQYQLGNVFYNTLRPSGYDPYIKWESTATYNTGIDFGFFANRLTGSIDYYYRKTSNLLNTIPVPAGTNLTNYITTNVGDLENKGIELLLNYKAIDKKDVSWDIAYNLGYNKNKITKLTQTDDPNYIGVQTGSIAGSTTGTIEINSVGYPVNSFYVYKQLYDDNGKPIEGSYQDRDNNNTINGSDLYRYKKAAPNFLMGISSRFNYKSWDFSFSGRASLGNYLYNNIKANYGTYYDLYSLGATKNVLSVARETQFANRQLFSDYYVENASFFRMDNIGIGYQFENILQKKWKLHINAVVQNAFIITNYSGLDPEVYSGIDNNIYPRARVFVIGANLNF